MTPTIHPDDALEYTRQMIVYGSVLLGEDGRVLQREEPEYWKAIRIGGRGSGKTYMQRHLERLHMEVQRVLDKTDELHRMAAGWQTSASRRTTPNIEPAMVRWGCTSPTGASPDADELTEYLMSMTRNMADALAGRTYAATRQEAQLRDTINDAASKVRFQ
jgi:hypothetical protein